MSHPPQIRLADAAFRAGADYTLVSFDRLEPHEQVLLPGFEADAEAYGLLRPRSAASRLVTKAVDQDTALLFLSLLEPGPLPAFVRRRLGHRLEPFVTGLVLDGVLEVGHDGRFLRGLEACALLGGVDQGAPEGPLARLSRQALRHAAAHTSAGPAELALQLYQFNRQPLTPAWKRLLPDEAAVARYLGFADGGLEPSRARQRWAPVTPRADNPHWFFWRRRATRRPSGPGTRSYKLYVSPPCSHLPAAFATSVEVLAASRAAAFKVGRDVYGLLRPDKLVAYFDQLEDLQSAGERLVTALEGMPTQGVPFTASLGGDGLVSWGIDPPSSSGGFAWQEKESWRMWLAQQLAAALHVARETAAPDLEPEALALARLRARGVDPRTWTPSETFWAP